MKRKYLSASGLYETAMTVFEKIPDLRNEDRREIPLKDALMSGLSVFALKSPSLLAFDKEVRNPALKTNMKNLFGITTIPDDTSMRRIIDDVDTNKLKSVFKKIFAHLQRGKALEKFKFLDDQYLISCDGTGYFSSEKIHCENCLEAHHKSGKITYSHQMLSAALVHPDRKEVIPLAPEPIIKQDGSIKNDCERNAGKRLVKQIRTSHPHLKIIIIEDALSGNLPRVELLKKYDMRFILGIKPGGHSLFFERMVEEKLSGNFLDYEKIDEEGIHHSFSFTNKIALKEDVPEVLVNFLDYTETDKKGKTTHFTWITDLELSKENIFEIMQGGRARWHIENEVFNTIKNQGYQFEHNFGHGQKNLSNNFAILMLLAFLIDQTQYLCSKEYQRARIHLRTWKGLWAKILSIFHLFAVPSWHDLLDYIGEDHILLPFPKNSS